MLFRTKGVLLSWDLAYSVKVGAATLVKVAFFIDKKGVEIMTNKLLSFSKAIEVMKKEKDAIGISKSGWGEGTYIYLDNDKLLKREETKEKVSIKAYVSSSTDVLGLETKWFVKYKEDVIGVVGFNKENYLIQLKRLLKQDKPNFLYISSRGDYRGLGTTEAIASHLNSSKEEDAYLLVQNSTVKKRVVRKYPHLKNRVLTLSDLKQRFLTDRLIGTDISKELILDKAPIYVDISVMNETLKTMDHIFGELNFKAGVIAFEGENKVNEKTCILKDNLSSLKDSDFSGQELPLKEFSESGLLWMVNSMLHIYDISLAYEEGEDALKPIYTNYNGFSEASNERGYNRVRKFMKK